ncbi:MAG: hypothetical protein K0R69_1577 [Clostridia bacterium]|jgi:hypothetical protein|nr:hypothetical protein [Clostridia bacterium]
MKKAFIEELQKLTNLQKEALEKDNLDEFTSLTQKKQVCIDEINAIINRTPSVLDDREKAILLETSKVDQENRAEFDKQFEEVKLQLRKIRALKKRDATYANPYDVSREEGIFFDKKQGKR